LGQCSREGWLTKQGGSIKTWKKRWFILKGNTLFYFKTRQDQDLTGSITLETASECKIEKSGGKKFFFSVSTAKRTYVIWASKEDVRNDWVSAINEKIAELKKGGPVPDGPKPPVTDGPSDDDSPGEAESDEGQPTKPAASPEPVKTTKEEKSSSSEMSSTISPRKQLAQAKSSILFLQDEESKVLEFWQIWKESIPEFEDLVAGAGIEYYVSTSASMEKLTWRTAGPQNLFIQKMVDFFWNVGAPESEIDRLNDVGALINPSKIGSWIDMSAKGGMDGGWFFPVDIALALAIEAADPGEPSRLVTDWATQFKVESCFSVGRDMGAAPPRQTEIRVRLPGATFAAQFEIAQAAFSQFGFPAIAAEAVAIFKAEGKTDLCLSIITSSEGFVRLGLMMPNPSANSVSQFCAWSSLSATPLQSFQKSMGSAGPAYVEYQYLKEGFGYSVYKEGPDIVFHYFVGEETIKST